MAVSAELIAFVKDGLQRGIPKTRLDEALRQAGWEREQVRGAIHKFADVDFVIPVPRPTAYATPREAFLYVVMFLTLYLSAYHLGSVAFSLIDQGFPDAAARMLEGYASVALRWSVASLIVTFPVFLYVAWIVGREITADVTKRASRVRRQLTYLTLFVASALLIGDITTLVYNFLGGDLTARFLLKVATVAIIAGTGFAYYLRELRNDERALEA